VYRKGKYVSDQETKAGKPRYAILYDRENDEYSVGKYENGTYTYSTFSSRTESKTEVEAVAKFNKSWGTLWK
jgi:hypothetical protein